MSRLVSLPCAGSPRNAAGLGRVDGGFGGEGTTGRGAPRQDARFGLLHPVTSPGLIKSVMMTSGRTVFIRTFRHGHWQGLVVIHGKLRRRVC